MSRGERRELFVDLHLHTNESDGVLSPAELVELVDRSGLERCAIVDHDTFGAYDRHAAVLARLDSRLVRGIEISTTTGGVGIHLLAYGVAAGASALRELLAGRLAARRERALQIVERLANLGVPVSTDDALGPESGRSVGRRHIAASLVRGGAVPDVQAAFDRYLGVGAPAYVPAAHVDTSVAIRAVRDSGGVAVMAHPSRGRAAACVPPWRSKACRVWKYSMPRTSRTTWRATASWPARTDS